MQVIARNKILQVMSVLILILGIGYLAGSLHIERQLQKREVVNLDISEDQKILFYRDDCPDCRKVFPVLYIKNFSKRDLIFVNLNQQKNRRYIHQYQLKEVPTIISGKSSYSGNNMEKITHTLQRSK